MQRQRLPPKTLLLISLFFSGLGIFFEQIHRRHDHTRRANSTLSTATLQERFLDGVKLVCRWRADSFYRTDLTPLHLQRAGTKQLLTSSPLTKTEHAPHSPSPHPSLVPVSLTSSRRMSSKRAIGWHSTVLVSPFHFHRERNFHDRFPPPSVRA